METKVLLHQQEQSPAAEAIIGCKCPEQKIHAHVQTNECFIYSCVFALAMKIYLLADSADVSSISCCCRFAAMAIVVAAVLDMRISGPPISEQYVSTRSGRSWHSAHAA